MDNISNQTLQNIEIVIVDDGSIDSTAYIVDKYAKDDSRFKIFHLANHGVAYVRQYALNRMTGRYVIHSDADDWLDIDMLEQLYHKAGTTNAVFGMRDKRSPCCSV